MSEESPLFRWDTSLTNVGVQRADAMWRRVQDDRFRLAN